MKRKRSEVKTELLNNAELLIDELLDWNDETEAPDLTQIENIVLKLRKQLGEQMALAVIDEQAAKRPSPGPQCPNCQREMHYKDVKANTVDKASGAMMDLAHATQNTYVAHLGGTQLFGQQFWSGAQRRQWTQAHDSIALGDGAPWIWNLVSEHFSDSRNAVDWYHASSHLSNAANHLHGDGSAEAQRWLQPHSTLLFRAHAERIADELLLTAASAQTGADELRREAGYFRDNRRRMKYMELREDGFPIGSGMVETGCKQFRARFSGSGMRHAPVGLPECSRPGVERLLRARAAILSQRFDQAWQAAYLRP